MATIATQGYNYSLRDMQKCQLLWKWDCSVTRQQRWKLASKNRWEAFKSRVQKRLGVSRAAGECIWSRFGQRFTDRTDRFAELSLVDFAHKATSTAGLCLCICCRAWRWTWADSGYGGDSSDVQTQLKNGQQIQASRCGSAFAAILSDRSVVTWDFAAFGGDSSAVQEQLKGVQQIQASNNAFCRRPC